MLGVQKQTDRPECDALKALLLSTLLVVVPGSNSSTSQDLDPTRLQESISWPDLTHAVSDPTRPVTRPPPRSEVFQGPIFLTRLDPYSAWPDSISPQLVAWVVSSRSEALTYLRLQRLNFASLWLTAKERSEVQPLWSLFASDYMEQKPMQKHEQKSMQKHVQNFVLHHTVISLLSQNLCDVKSCMKLW